MTKLRAPFSVEEALVRVADLIGWPAVRRIADRGMRTVRHWSEPDMPFGCPADVAIRLDIAFRAAGGAGLPFHDAHRHHLDAAAAPAIGAVTLSDCFSAVLRECPDAAPAIFVVMGAPGIIDPGPAVREIDQAIAALLMARAALLATGPQVVHLGLPP